MIWARWCVSSFFVLFIQSTIEIIDDPCIVCIGGVSRQRARFVLLVPRPDSETGDQRKPNLGRFGAAAVLKARAVERIGKRRSVETFRPFGVIEGVGVNATPLRGNSK